MPGIESTPGAQASVVRFAGSFGSRALVAKGDIKHTGASLVRTPIADAHTARRKTMARHQAKALSATFVTDQNLEFLDGMEDARITVVELNGRIIRALGVTNITDAGRTENTTTGETDEFTFMCDELTVLYP